MNAVSLICLALCLSFAAAQLDFTADFEMRHPFLSGGVVRGTINYGWSSARAYKLFYPTQGYQEISVFNPARGFAPISVTDRPFFNQWVYKSGRTCACETGPNEEAMPQFFIDSSVPSNFTATGQTFTINGVTCAEYETKPDVPADVKTIYWSTSTNKICRAVMKDFTEYTFTNVNSATQAASVFTPPAGCKCGQPMDLAIVLDRSGSISQTEFKNQKNFVTGFTNAFSYGPLGANLALVHFKSNAWTTLTMTEGVSDQNVLNAVTALKCCTTSSNMAESCCCCGTSVSSGMRMGVDQLKLGRTKIGSTNVEKVLLVISDGYHNHDSTGKECVQQGAVCRADLQAATDYAKRQIPDIKIFSVGVGADRDISMDELLIVADQKPERVMRYTDFTSLAQNSLDLVARACQENLNPCGGCCGFCVCGQCTAPDACDSTNFCNPNAVQGVCCKETPRDCADPTDLCATYTCDAAQGACLATPIACKPNVPCFNYTCVPATGLCSTIPNPACPTTQPECTAAADCNDFNACTRDICDTATQLCRWESTAADCNDNNLCTVDECHPTDGCKNTAVPADYCDDQSVCTTDVCDPQRGCVNTNITCADDNACTDDICDPFKGCLGIPKVCPNDGEDKCKLFFCLNGTCTFRKAGDCGPPVVVLAATLSTAAIVGIVIGVVLCVAGLGAGGAYAYSQAAGVGSAAPVANNPIYVGSGAQGQNPLYKS